MGRIPLEKKKSYKNAMAAIAFVAALAGAIAAVVKLVPERKVVHDVREMMEIVLDRSEGMSRPFDGVAKIQAAADSARSVLDSVADSDVLALRQFGGRCDGENSRIAVKPSQNNRKKIQDSLKSRDVGGQSSLAQAVIQATGDFDESERFKGVFKRIVVITGSRDACPQTGDPIAAIRNRMDRIKSANIHLDFHFIGIGLDDSEREELSNIAKATGGAKPAFVDRRQELEGALRKVLVVDPVVQDTQSLVTLLNAGVDHLNGVFTAIGKKQYEAAKKGLSEARDESAKSQSSWDDLGKGPRKEQFQKLYDTAAESRRIWDDLLNLAGTMLSQAEANDIEGYNVSASRFNRLSEDYNRNEKSISILLKEM